MHKTETRSTPHCPTSTLSYNFAFGSYRHSKSFPLLIIAVFIMHLLRTSAGLVINSNDRPPLELVNIPPSNKTISRANAPNVIMLGYISAINRFNRSMYKRHGRRFSGAISYAVNRINNSSILPADYRLDFVMKETYGRTRISIKNTAELCVNGKVSAIIGPQESCYTEGKIATSFNMPMLTYYCDDLRVSDKQEFPTFIRTRPKAEDIAMGVASLLLHFNWTKIAYITTSDAEYGFFVSNIKEVLIKRHITVLVHKSYEHPYLHGLSKNSFMDLVEETYRIARIYVIVGEYYEPVGLVHNLERRGLIDTGQYFVIGVDKRFYKYNKPSSYINTWVHNQSFLPETSAFRAYLHVTLRGPSKVEEVRDLEKMNRYYLTKPPFNLEMKGIREGEPKKKVAIQPETGYLYDAVMMYAMAVGKILKEKLGLPNDGQLVKKQLIGRQYMSSLGYLNRINDDGDAVGNYTVLHLHNGGLYPVGMFQMSLVDKNLPRFKLLNGKKIVWIGGKKPADEPECGFDGKKCKTAPNNTAKIMLPIFATVLLVGMIVGIFLYRNHRIEQELDMLLWKIDAKDMEPLFETHPLRTGVTNKYYLQNSIFSSLRDLFKPKISIGQSDANNSETASGKPPLSRRGSRQLMLNVERVNINAERMRRSASDLHNLVQSDNGDELTSALIPNESTKKNSFASLFPYSKDDGSEIKQFFTQVCRYKRQVVAVKKVYKSNINVSRVVKKELKLLRDITNQNNSNLTKFLGACVDDPNICVVWEYCERGSLQDILYNEDLSLGHMFITSLVLDIIRGLVYLHESDFRFHGNLKSSNCVVDSRWVLKLTDFSLNEYKAGQTLDHLDEQAYFQSLFWTGPEFLRYMVSKKPYGSLTQHMARLVDDLRGMPLSSTLTQLDVTAYQRSDIYSFGIILWELFSREFPFSPTNHAAREIIRRVIVLNDKFHVPYRPKMSQLSTVDKYITDCISVCLSEDPAARPNIKQVRNRLKALQSDKSQNIIDNVMTLMETYAKNLERLVSERSGQLQEEKKRTEELLYQMLPVPVAEQLKRGKQVEAEAFDCVTIYFSDIVGFTELSADSTPFEVVQLLNDLYTTFDSIISAYDVYKVETIGDAYMVVSGLPKRNDYHAGEIASMSLRLLNVIKLGFTIHHRPTDKLKLRIGIHSGPCCAGVVGTRMPRFCLFGDTVNTASRMESNGEPYKIHISEHCKIELDRLGGYRVQSRGEIPIKGKGTARTYWLLGKTKPSTHLLNQPLRRQRKQPWLKGGHPNLEDMPSIDLYDDDCPTPPSVERRLNRQNSQGISVHICPSPTTSNHGTSSNPASERSESPQLPLMIPLRKNAMSEAPNLSLSDPPPLSLLPPSPGSKSNCKYPHVEIQVDIETSNGPTSIESPPSDYSIVTSYA